LRLRVPAGQGSGLRVPRAHTSSASTFCAYPAPEHHPEARGHHSPQQGAGRTRRRRGGRRSRTMWKPSRRSEGSSPGRRPQLSSLCNLHAAFRSYLAAEERRSAGEAVRHCYRPIHPPLPPQGGGERLLGDTRQARPSRQPFAPTRRDEARRPAFRVQRAVATGVRSRCTPTGHPRRWRLLRLWSPVDSSSKSVRPDHTESTRACPILEYRRTHSTPAVKPPARVRDACPHWRGIHG